jgi:hypothetical protein
MEAYQQEPEPQSSQLQQQQQQDQEESPSTLVGLQYQQEPQQLRPYQDELLYVQDQEQQQQQYEQERQQPRQHVVGLASTGRALCRGRRCGLNISKGELRVGSLANFGRSGSDHFGYYWHHMSQQCSGMIARVIGQDPTALAGYDVLPPSRQAVVDAWLKGQDVVAADSDYADGNTAEQELGDGPAWQCAANLCKAPHTQPPRVVCGSILFRCSSEECRRAETQHPQGEEVALRTALSCGAAACRKAVTVRLQSATRSCLPAEVQPCRHCQGATKALVRVGEVDAKKRRAEYLEVHGIRQPEAKSRAKRRRVSRDEPARPSAPAGP